MVSFLMLTAGFPLVNLSEAGFTSSFVYPNLELCSKIKLVSYCVEPVTKITQTWHDIAIPKSVSAEMQIDW
jgi:hypothetical protein